MIGSLYRRVGVSKSNGGPVLSGEERTSQIYKSFRWDVITFREIRGKCLYGTRRNEGKNF